MRPQIYPFDPTENPGGRREAMALKGATILLVFALAGSACAHYPINAPLAGVDSRTGYRFENTAFSTNDAQSSLTSLDADLRFEGVHSISRGSYPISTGGGVSGRLTKTPTRGIRTAGQTARLPHIE
jgi:hypothetical protein